MDRMTDHSAHPGSGPASGPVPGRTAADALAAHLAARPVAADHAIVIDWRRKMSDHIAYALLVYTALQIFVTVGALKSHGGSLLPYFALVILVVAIIPACRRFEARWNRLNDEQAQNPELVRYYRRDRLALWLLAIGLPLALTALFKGLALAFAKGAG